VIYVLLCVQCVFVVWRMLEDFLLYMKEKTPKLVLKKTVNSVSSRGTNKSISLRLNSIYFSSSTVLLQNSFHLKLVLCILISFNHFRLYVLVDFLPTMHRFFANQSISHSHSKPNTHPLACLLDFIKSLLL